MTKIILDQAALPQFDNLRERTEVCDTTGRIVGYFIPVGKPSRYEGVEPPITEEELQQRERLLLYQTMEVPFTKEELDRFAQEPGGRSLAEILADLEKRA